MSHHHCGFKSSTGAALLLFLLASFSVPTEATFKCRGNVGEQLCRTLTNLGLPKPKCCSTANAPVKSPTQAPIAVAAPMVAPPVVADPGPPMVKAPVVAPPVAKDPVVKAPVKAPKAPVKAPAQVPPPKRSPTVGSSRVAGCFRNGMVYGDPHLATFDNVYYSCQARGEFTLYNSVTTGARVHGRFEKKSPQVSLTTGVAARAAKSTPVVELSIPKNGTEQVQLFVKGVKVANPLTGYSDSSVQVTHSSNVFSLFFPTSGLSVVATYIPLSFRHFSVIVRHPCTAANQTIRGLLGSPDDKPDNDWMSTSGAAITIPTSVDLTSRTGFDYCKNWCISNATESLFVAEGTHPFSSYNGCNETFPGDVSRDRATSNMRDLCGSNVACLVDGIELGLDASRNVLTAEATLARLASNARFRAWPSTVLVNQSTVVALTVNLTGSINASAGIDQFLVFRVDPVTQAVGTSPIVALRDVGSGAGNDTVARDFVFSDVIAVRSTGVGESFAFRAVPVIRGVTSPSSSFTIQALNAIRSYSTASGIVAVAPTNSSFPIRFQLPSVNGLVLVIEYSWPADKRDLDTGTYFLGQAKGFDCIGNSPYVTFTGDDTGLGGKETITVALGRSFVDNKWNSSTFVDMNAGWYEPPNRGPASISLSTRQVLGNGTITAVSGNNVVSFVVDPGVQDGCAATKVAVARVRRASDGKVTIEVTAA